MRRGTAFLLAVLAIGASLAAPARAQVAHTVPVTNAGAVLGRTVTDSAGDDAGPLVDLIVDAQGQPVAGVVDVGGFLGVGARRVAIAWPLLHFKLDADGMHVTMALTIAAAAAAPEVQGSEGGLIVIDKAP